LSGAVTFRDYLQTVIEKLPNFDARAETGSFILQKDRISAQIID
jgi:hypothetical protein